MQRLLRAAALTRTHFDGDPVSFGVCTAPPAGWANFSSLADMDGADLEAECPASLLALPPGRCDEGEPPPRSVSACKHDRDWEREREREQDLLRPR